MSTSIKIPAIPAPLALLCLLATLASAADTPTPPSTSPDALFAEANAAYEEGKFEQASKLYSSIIASGSYSPDLFYNLGNSLARLDQPGAALLNYQRALALSPHHAEAAFNASYLRSKLPEIPVTSSPAARFFGHFSASEYALMASVGFWVMASAATIALLGRLTPPVLAVGLLSALTLALGITGFLVQRPLDPSPNSAMCTASSARAHFAPATSSPVVAPIPPGTPLEILSEKNDWLYVRLPDRRLGWMPSSDVETLIPKKSS